MKQINITVEDKLHKQLIDKKGDLTWIKFLELIIKIPDLLIEKEANK